MGATSTEKKSKIKIVIQILLDTGLKLDALDITLYALFNHATSVLGCQIYSNFLTWWKEWVSTSLSTA